METDRKGSRDGRALLVWRRWTYIVPVVGCVVAVAGPAMAQSPGLYNTSRTLAHLGNECLGVPSCRTVESQRTTVDVGKHTSITVRCPRSHPHLTGWDTEQSEHLAAHLPPLTVRGANGNPARAVPSGEISVLTLLVTNHADVSGAIKVFIGCTEEVPRVTAFRQHRGAVPSNHGSLAPPSFTQGGQR
jgi:hypothetical protein